MEIYHTETQEDYDALMIKLEEQGCKWLSGRKPTETTKNWKRNLSESCVRVGKKMAMYDKKSYYTRYYPDTPIIKYKAKVDEKMKFTKENVEKVIDEYFWRADLEPCSDLIAEIHNLDDTRKKVVVPKFVAEWIEWNKETGASSQNMLRGYGHYYNNVKSYSKADGKKAMQWYLDNPCKFIQAYENGYTIEPDTVTEQRYTVVIADRYLVQLFIGRTDYRFVEFDELCAWKPNAFQLTEAEIKAIDERYWTFAKPIKEEEQW